jgi:hypothetical protein
VDIDSRLEALTQTVELLAHVQQETERVQREMWEANERRFAKIARIFQQEHEAIKDLANIAARHEQRLNEIQGE